MNAYLAEESLVADAALSELGRVNSYISFSSVQHVGHPEVKQVVDLNRRSRETFHWSKQNFFCTAKLDSNYLRLGAKEFRLQFNSKLTI